MSCCSSVEAFSCSYAFSGGCGKRIHQFTSGILRVINQICRHCLIDMESNQLELADHQVLERVLSEFQY
ncbi:MAG: hypothetical protein AAGU27_27990 [Dehalobacterium sp.]